MYSLPLQDPARAIEATSPRSIDAPELSTSTGHGAAIGHNGEILQGVFVGGDHRLHRALVSLPCPIFQSTAVFIPSASGELIVEPCWKTKARDAARAALERAGVPHWGGYLKIASATPPGWGLGSSTSDVVAAIRAVMDITRRCFSAREIARLAVDSERASDSIMFVERAVLFAHREGRVLEELHGGLPPLEVLGFLADDSEQGIDTLSWRRARYTWEEIELFRPLLGLLRRAVASGDARLLGRVATASARLNQRHLPKPRLERVIALAGEIGAAGVQVAHSGTVMGLLFDAGTTQLDARMSAARESLKSLGFPVTWRFSAHTTL